MDFQFLPIASSQILERLIFVWNWSRVSAVVVIIISFPFWETQIHFPSLNEKAHQKSGNKLTAAKKRNGWLTKKKQQPSFSTESLFIETTLLGKNANYKFIQIIVWEKNRSQKKDHKKWVEFFTKSF